MTMLHWIGVSRKDEWVMSGNTPTSLNVPPEETELTKTMHHRASRYRRSESAEPIRLTERDKQVVKTVNDYRLIRQDQIQRLAFPSRNTAQLRLHKLWEHGFLRRRFLPVLGGIQTSPILYEIDRRGVELLRTEFHYQESALRYSRTENVAIQFIYHTLGLSEIRLAVELSCQANGMELKMWRDEKALKSDYDRVQVGKRLEAVLPDAYIVLRLPEQRLLYFFLEYDRGLENLKFIRKKMAAYVSYFETGLCKQRYGTSQIRVLTVSEGKSSKNSSSRLAHLKKMTEEVGGGFRFYFTDLTSISSYDVLVSPIWQIAGETNPAPILQKNQSSSAKED